MPAGVADLRCASSQLGEHVEAVQGIERYLCGKCEFGEDSNVELGTHMGAVHDHRTEVITSRTESKDRRGSNNIISGIFTSF